MKMINLSINRNNVETSFERIAKELMNEWSLACGKNLYRIAEVEFYLRTINKEDNWHHDSYVHGHDLQKTSHRWYFHGAGIDLTFGQEDFYGGILIRALCNIENGEYHYGPLKLLVELFGQFPEVYGTNHTFGLIPAEKDQFKREDPIAAPRVGLNPKTDIDMFEKNYRFLIMPKKQHADKTKIAEAMKGSRKYTQNEINNIWG